MLFKLRSLRETDYEDVLVGWWKDWGWDPPAKDFLPENGKGGIIVLEQNTPVCAGFIYMTNSRAAWTSWIISNKKYRKKPLRKQAISFLIDTLTSICKEQGCKYVFANNNHPHIINTLKLSGFKVGDINSTQLIKIL